jgi:hypothetical protein
LLNCATALVLNVKAMHEQTNEFKVIDLISAFHLNKISLTKRIVALARYSRREQEACDP